MGIFSFNKQKPVIEPFIEHEHKTKYFPNYSDEELAKYAGISPEHFNRLEKLLTKLVENNENNENNKDVGFNITQTKNWLNEQEQKKNGRDLSSINSTSSLVRVFGSKKSRKSRKEYTSVLKSKRKSRKEHSSVLKSRKSRKSKKSRK